MEARIVIDKKNDSDLTLEELFTNNHKYDKLSFYEVLDTVIADELMNVIAKIRMKLNPQAIVSIQGYDLFELAYSIVNDRIPTIEFNRIIQDKKQLLCIPDIMSVLIHLGFKILSKDIDATKYLVEAQYV